MALPNNILQQVQTYQKAELAWLLNSNVGIFLANKMFKDFNNRTANLGDTVTFDLTPRAVTTNGLVVSQEQSIQRVQSLACTQAANSASAFSSQQFIFNVRDYMTTFGMTRVKELGSQAESDVLKNIVSGVTVNDPQNPNFGTNINLSSGPYRFYGDGTTAINSYGQLAKAIANFKDYGSSDYMLRGILPMTIIPDIINSGLSQFATNRNNEDAKRWELGPFSGCDWYESNLLPVHYAGTAGDTAATLTLVSTNDPSGANITQLTFSSALGTDANAIKAGDLLQFNDGVSGQPNVRYLTFIGHLPSGQPVQFRATADAASTAGTVTVDIYPPLQSTPGQGQNLNNSLSAGMEVSVVPSHRAGVLMSGDPLYLAMPKLNDQDPFSTVTTTDSDTGASIRHYWGTQFGQNKSSYVWDMIWGSTLIAENSMRFVVPLNQ